MPTMKQCCCDEAHGMHEGMEMMGTSSMLYPALKAYDMVLANVIVIILGLLTSILPAWRAANLDPIRALNTN